MERGGKINSLTLQNLPQPQWIKIKEEKQEKSMQLQIQNKYLQERKVIFCYFSNWPNHLIVSSSCSYFQCPFLHFNIVQAELFFILIMIIILFEFWGSSSVIYGWLDFCFIIFLLWAFCWLCICRNSSRLVWGYAHLGKSLFISLRQIWKLYSLIVLNYRPMF